MTNISPESLGANLLVCDALARSFDFDLARRGIESFQIKGGGFVPIAGDAAGGAFLLGDSGYLLYVTSEGAAGVIAASLTEGLQIMVAFPNWQSLLKFSGGGDIAQMRRAALVFEKEGLDSEIVEDCSFLKSELLLPEGSDPIALLHHAVKILSPSVKFELRIGEKFESLFNTFTIDDVEWGDDEQE